MRIQRLRPRLALWVATIAVVIFGGVTLAYAAVLHGWPWDGPGRLSLCGRDYDPEGSPITLQQLDRRLGRSVRLYPAYQAMAPIGPEVYADTSPAQRAAPRRPGEPCSGSLYTRAADGYQMFNLSGSS
ncbi:MAG TPA: hypothetical protein VMF14_06205 [Solirubrobacteraceae bacterium]|nr:hypothetical protein [Solirubrobacteraceae bacterium]